MLSYICFWYLYTCEESSMNIGKFTPMRGNHSHGNKDKTKITKLTVPQSLPIDSDKFNVYQDFNSILISKIRLLTFSKMANIDRISYGTNKNKINPKQLPNNIRYIFQIINYKCATNCSIYWILYPVHSIGEAFPIIEEENKLPCFFWFYVTETYMVFLPWRWWKPHMELAEWTNRSWVCIGKINYLGEIDYFVWENNLFLGQCELEKYTVKSNFWIKESKFFRK